MSNTPTLAEVINNAIAQGLAGVSKCMPAKVVTYDDTTQRCSAKPLIKRPYLDEDGDRQVESRPVVNDVPVIFPGSGGRRIKWDVLPGDVVLLLFADASLDAWLSEGGEVDPIDDRKHSPNDAVAIPGLFGPGASDKAPIIEFTGGEIRLGEGSTDPVARKSDFDALKSAIAGVGVAAGDGGAAFKTNLAAAAFWSSVGSVVVKAD